MATFCRSCQHKTSGSRELDSLSVTLDKWPADAIRAFSRPSHLYEKSPGDEVDFCLRLNVALLKHAVALHGSV